VTISDVSENAGHETTVALAKTYGSEKVHFVHCDVTNEGQFKDLWDASEAFFKAPVDVLVNNAGINHTQGWKKCMDIDIVSPQS
jgi:15-hydroxyprostaglandin dehydrogenase (NAD)